jgi:hypothetical protein
MALAHYTDTFWFPSGVLAANVASSIFPKNSSTLATLYTDASGTVPLANPTSTNGTGVLSFWAEPGEYWVHLDTETFGVTVGMSQEQADLSTGVASGGELTPNALVPSSVDIGAMDGYIVDYMAGDQSEPVITRVKTQDQTVPMDAAALARAVTYWLIDSTGAVIQQAAKPDVSQRRTHILLGVTAHTGGVIGVSQSVPVVLANPVGQLHDLMEALGAFVISGGVISPNGANLQLNQSAGTIFARSFNHYDNNVLTNNPHVVATQAQAPVQFIQILQNTTVAPAITTVVDVANYDNGGVLTPVGGGANQSQILRVWQFANDPPFQTVITYGQSTYASLSAAVAAIGAGNNYTVNPYFVEGNGGLVGYIAVVKTATDLSNPAQAVFVRAGKFPTP